MARLNDSKNQNGKNFSVNIAGDYSPNGLDIEPSEPFIDRADIRPNGNGGVQFEDEIPPSERENQNQDFTQTQTQRAAEADANATVASLNSATGQSTLGQEAGKRLVNPAKDPN